MTTDPTPKTIDAYIAAFPPEVRTILKRIRQTISTAAPDAQEVISYRMPAFKLHGLLVYFAAFKNHIRLYPPVSGDEKLEKAIAPYAGPKGNLKFPLDQPIPYSLIKRIAKFRMKQNAVKAALKSKKKRGRCCRNCIASIRITEYESVDSYDATSTTIPNDSDSQEHSMFLLEIINVSIKIPDRHC